MEYINNLINSIQNINVETITNISIAIGIFILFKIISAPLAYTIIKMFNFKVKSIKKLKEHGFYNPLKIFIGLLGLYIGLYILRLPEDIFAMITKAFRICTISLVANGLANLFNTASDTYIKLMEKFNFKSTGTTVAFVSKIIKALVYIVAGFMIISDLGYNLGGLATGLGISSVVIALAAQDLTRNIIAGFSILTDRPFEIGDSIEKLLIARRIFYERFFTIFLNSFDINKKQSIANAVEDVMSEQFKKISKDQNKFLWDLCLKFNSLPYGGMLPEERAWLKNQGHDIK